MAESKANLDKEFTARAREYYEKYDRNLNPALDPKNMADQELRDFFYQIHLHDSRKANKLFQYKAMREVPEELWKHCESALIHNNPDAIRKVQEWREDFLADKIAIPPLLIKQKDKMKRYLKHPKVKASIDLGRDSFLPSLFLSYFQDLSDREPSIEYYLCYGLSLTLDIKGHYELVERLAKQGYAVAQFTYFSENQLLMLENGIPLGDVFQLPAELFYDKAFFSKMDPATASKILGMLQYAAQKDTRFNDPNLYIPKPILEWIQFPRAQQIVLEHLKTPQDVKELARELHPDNLAKLGPVEKQVLQMYGILPREKSRIAEWERLLGLQDFDRDSAKERKADEPGVMRFSTPTQANAAGGGGVGVAPGGDMGEARKPVEPKGNEKPKKKGP